MRVEVADLHRMERSRREEMTMATTQSKPKALGHDARPKLHLRAPHNRLIKKLDLDKIYITRPG